MRASCCFLVCLLLAGVAWAQGPTAAETTAFQAATPVFQKYCYRCHTSKGRKAKTKALAYLNMDQYPFSGERTAKAGSAVRMALAPTGNDEPTMPKDDPGIVRGGELEKILAWAAIFERLHETSRR